MPEPPAAGDRAPAFRLRSTAGETALADLLGSGRVVLAFYAEDATPSCQTQLSMLKDAHELLREFGAQVVAVSADSLESHRAFAERLGGLPFPLASDASLDAARAYGVIDEGDVRRSRRAVFVIERDGTLLLSMPHFQPGNLSQVEATFAALGMESQRAPSALRAALRRKIVLVPAPAAFACSLYSINSRTWSASVMPNV